MLEWINITPRIPTSIYIREVEMVLHVQYRDNHYDYVDAQTLDRLLAGKEVRRFYRPSEKRWVYVDRDPIRGSGRYYSGPDRRQPTVTKRRVMRGSMRMR